jgi:hypothetical protein
MRKLTIAATTLFSSPAWACANSMHAAESDWTAVALISAIVVAGGGLSLMFVVGACGAFGISAAVLLEKRTGAGAVQGATGISSDGDAPPDVWHSGSR